MAMRSGAPTLSGEVHDRLRDQILSGEFHPGQRLSPNRLRESFGVSVSVVREALAKLTEQQLVVSRPNQGFTVAPLSRKTLEEITQVRLELESFALRLAIANGDLEWESAVLAAHHMLEGTPHRNDNGDVTAQWIAAHAKFHHQILAGCGNATLLQLCSALFTSAEMYRRWSEPSPSLEHRDVAREHREIAEAVTRRDAAQAVALLQRHISLTVDLAIENIALLHGEP